jgi:hypothetical protein
MADEYRGHKLQLSPSGQGWKVFIYEPGATVHLPEVPATSEMFGVAEILAEAKRIVDKRLLSKSDG